MTAGYLSLRLRKAYGMTLFCQQNKKKQNRLDAGFGGLGERSERMTQQRREASSASDSGRGRTVACTMLSGQFGSDQEKLQLP